MQPTRAVRGVLITVFTALSGYLGYAVATLLNDTDYVNFWGKYAGLKNQAGLRLAETLLEALFFILGMLLGFLFASRVVKRVARLGHTLEEVPAREKVAIIIGLLLGLAFTGLVAFLLQKAVPESGTLLTLLTLFSAIVLNYLTVSATMSMSNELSAFFPGGHRGPSGKLTAIPVKVLDTNVVIDGRISDVMKSGFLEGTLYVPGFVLDELQHIADSSDALKRARGRRGLEILNEMKEITQLEVEDFDNIEDIRPSMPVDQKLVVVAKHLQGAIVTNDFNLNKVAELQGVKVLNINELANAVKPVVLPGEEMTVQIIKEGKEANQGVGYLEDGTMIVVEGGKRHIGEHLQVVVSSVLQTVAGKMIFTQMRERDPDGFHSAERSARIRR